MKKKILNIIMIFTLILNTFLPIHIAALEKTEKEEIEYQHIEENNNDENLENIPTTEESNIEESKEQKEEIIIENNETIEEITPKEETIVEGETINEEETISEEEISKNEKAITSYTTSTPGVFYKSHVQDIGWQDYYTNGKTSGTTNKSLRLEALQIHLDSKISGNIQYTSHIQDIGWEEGWKSNDEITGTMKQSKRLEALRIRLDGEIGKLYDVYYRVHSQDYGWLGWAKNGEIAGTIGFSKRVEAIEIKLVEKGTGETTGNSYVAEVQTFTYQSHIQSIGWQSAVTAGQISGTTGQKLRIEAFKAKISRSIYKGKIRYKSYIEGKGWEKEWITSNNSSGTEHESKKLLAIQIELTEELAEVYDVYYRVHIQDYGWLGWAKNGEIAGSLGTELRMESIEAILVLKGTGEITGQSSIEKETTITYNSHVQDVGNTAIVNEGETTGTTGQKLRLEGYTINLNTTLAGNIMYQTYIEGSGWESSWKKQGEFSGTIKQSKATQLIRIKLTDELAEKYNIYYRVHSDAYGWLGWAKNGEDAGATYYDIQAIEIKLYLKKDTNQNSLATKNHYVLTGFYMENGRTKYKDKNGNQATDWITIMNRKYFFNSLGQMIGEDVKKVIDVSGYQKKIDWKKVAEEGNIDGVIVRIAAGCDYEDSYLSYNIQEIKKYGIPYGIYIYSYAENYNEGVLYANFTKKMIEKYSMNPTMGIFLDLESNDITSYMGNAEYTQVVSGYFDTMKNAGYETLTHIYTYKSMADGVLNSDYIRSKITWIAQYNHNCTYTGTYKGWQYSSNQYVPGIEGTVDMSVWFNN